MKCKRVFSILIIAAMLFCCGCSEPSLEGSTPPSESIPSSTVPVTETDESIPDYSEFEILLGTISSDRNWINAAIGCIFETPEQIDLYYLFYLGIDGGTWQDISPDSEQALIEQGFMREFDLQVMPVPELDRILQTYFGISLSDAEIPEEWCYIEAENAYCSNHSDAYFVLPNSITNVYEVGDGTTAISYTVDGYYNTKTDEFYDLANLFLTLRETEAGWQVISNKITE